MGVKYKTTKDEFPKLEKTIEMFKDRKVNVGHLDGGEQAWLAGIHEYGCTIPVTPDMRAWLHRHGLHLKKSTTEIHIPERSFLRAGFDAYHEQVIDVAEKALKNALKNGNVDAYLEEVGQLLRDRIVDYANDLKDPPKHPFSLQMNPGKTNPLVISGDMIEATTYEVE